MAIVLSHTTAAAILASPLLKRGALLPYDLSSPEPLRTPTPTNRATIEALKAQLPQPIHILVPPNSGWKRTRTLVPHEFSGALHADSIWRLTDTVLICSQL